MPSGNVRAEGDACPAADYLAGELVPVWDEGPGIRFRACSRFFGPDGLDCCLRLLGTFNVANALPAMAVARHMGVSAGQICQGLYTASIRGRCEVAGSVRGAYIVLDYAHNGRSLASVLKIPWPICSEKADLPVWLRRQPFKASEERYGSSGIFWRGPADHYNG